MKIYTKQGDQGKTSLLGGERIEKYDQRVWAYGTVDEANSLIGFAKSLCKDKSIKELLTNIQNTLFDVGAELASLGTKGYKERIEQSHVLFIEKNIDKIDEKKPKLSKFIVPGGSKESAAFDVARCSIRKSERYIVNLNKSYNVNENLLKYINRLSDFLFTLARYMDYKYVLIESKKRVEYFMSGKLDRKLSLYITDKCIEKSEEIGVPVVICVADSSGNIISVQRMEEALLASINIAQNKAYTAVAFKLPTHELNEISKPDRQLHCINNMKNIVTFGGGFPLEVNNKIVGAIGVSGGSVEEDMAIAQYGLKAFEEAYNYGIRE